MARRQTQPDFLGLLADVESEDDGARLPSLNELSDQLGVSVSRVREQLEVARALGWVEVRPRTGIRRLPYAFFPAMRQSLDYAIALDRRYFEQFSDLRNQVEAAYWHRSVALLTDEDLEDLRALVQRAWQKLRGSPVRIPHREHRDLHLAIFRRLDNTFVQGILEAFWDAYEAIGLNLYAEYDYLQRVWAYHQEMIEALSRGDADAGFQALVAHKDLLYHRPGLVENQPQEAFSGIEEA
jgi:DNA-binding FadR family transcriptional regulator